MGINQLSKYISDPDIDIITGACPHDCPDTCSWQVAVSKTSGQAVDIWGHPDHPVTAGMLCTKVDHYLERTYHRDRLTTPLKRIGPKGSGEFKPVSWDEAISDIATRLNSVIDKYGEESVFQYSYAGTMGLLQQEGMAQRFFNRMGASRLGRTICSATGSQGYEYTIGGSFGILNEAFAESKLILIWGSNTITANVHLWPFIKSAQNDGARVIVIDPVRTRTARLADDWIAVKPGTDSALALAMMHVIIAEELHDVGYVDQHTIGFEGLRERVADWTPSRAEEITGVPADSIRELARAYATTRPAAIRLNYGMARHQGGGMAARTIACLPALIGAWREYGGGVQLSAGGYFGNVDNSGLRRPDLLGDRNPRVINMVRLGDALSLDPNRIAASHSHPRPIDSIPTPAQAGPPIKAMIVYNCNPAVISPDQSAVIEGLKREDLFTVVLEHFQTDTADYADYVLPATTQLEHWDIVFAYGHLHVSLNRPAIEPLAESQPNSEIFRRMAIAMGYDDECFRETDVEILKEFVERQTHSAFDTITWDGLLRAGYQRLNVPDRLVPFEEGGFPTPSGKCEFYSRQMTDDGYDPLPNYTEPAWSRAGLQENELVCISPPAHSFLNSSFANVDRFIQREQTPKVHIRPEDAEAFGIVDGSAVAVSSNEGELVLTAKVDDGLARGTIMAPGIWWAKYSPDGRSVNQLTAQIEADMGAGPCIHDVAARIQIADDLS